VSSRRSPRWLSLIAAAALVVQLSARSSIAAPGQPSGVEGFVLAVENGDVIVDLGSSRGATVGEVVELWRPIEVIHPVTHQHLRDRYRIGLLKLVQVRDRMAVAVPEGATKRPPAPGDSVVWRRAPEPSPLVAGAAAAAATPVAPSAAAGRVAAPAGPESAPAAPAPPATPASASVGGLDAESVRVRALLASAAQMSLLERIRAYVAYVKQNPESPYAFLLRADAVQYHRLLRAEERAGGPASAEGISGSPTVPSSAIDFTPLTLALEGRSLDVGLHLPPPYVGAVLHVRPPSAVGYRTLPMAGAGSGHFRVTVPGELIQTPRVQYFIEAVDRTGRSASAAGTEDDPLVVEIERAPSEASSVLQTRTKVAWLADFADYNRLRGNDQTFQTEGLLGMRFADVGMRALRTGFGVYRGKGGTLRDLDELHEAGRSVGLTYGYLEGEYAFIPRAALIARAVCGLTEDGISGGALGLVRIGGDLETNLSLGGEILGGVGVRSITQLELRLFPRLPLLLRNEVTNQPAGFTGPRLTPAGQSQGRGELGQRTIVQVGYEFSPAFTVALRGSVQGRTIYHAGPGFGGEVSYSW
jgi:hypothetical protein